MLQNNPAPEPQAAQVDDLDALLAQYTDGTSGASEFDPTPDLLALERQQLTAQQQELSAHAQQLAHAEASAKAARDLEELAADVRADLDPNIFNDEFVKTWIDSKARQDQQLQQLWLNREQNPRAFAIAAKHLAKEFHKMAKQVPDEQVTEDRLAVAQAVKGTGGRAPESSPVNLGRLSDAELRNHVRSSYGFDPGF